jgi:hypothetical protein
VIFPGILWTHNNNTKNIKTYSIQIPSCSPFIVTYTIARPSLCSPKQNTPISTPPSEFSLFKIFLHIYKNSPCLQIASALGTEWSGD